MRWNKPHSVDSPQGLPGRDRPASTAWVRHPGMENVRQAMLQSLIGTSGCAVARMNMRLRYAGDIEALWYLRTDLFSILAGLRGESAARAAIDQITLLFQGQLPRPLRTLHLPRMH